MRTVAPSRGDYRQAGHVAAGLRAVQNPVVEVELFDGRDYASWGRRLQGDFDHAAVEDLVVHRTDGRVSAERHEAGVGFLPAADYGLVDGDRVMVDRAALLGVVFEGSRDRAPDRNCGRSIYDAGECDGGGLDCRGNQD